MNRRGIRYGAAIIAVYLATVLLTALLMRPPLPELLQLALTYGATALVSVAIGFAAQRGGWWRRTGSLTRSLTLGYLLAALLTLLNVWVAARLMFISPHDLALASVLLLFASGVSVSFGYLLSTSLSGSLRRMVDAAERLSGGDFGARVPVEGRDEVAQLGKTFNRMAERLQAADREARRLERARRDFVAWVSHDLRTPLSALRAMIDAMTEGVVTDEATVARYLKRSQVEVDRLSGLIDDLFELSRLDAGHLEVERELCSLSDLISDTVGAAAARAEARAIELTGEVDPRVDPVRIAPDQIGRALHNLVDNALRHTPHGGEIHVRAGLQAGQILVEVRDSGPGLDPLELEAVFQRFYRGERSRARQDGSGAGLGLAIAKGFVEAHGGEIWVDTAPKTGAVFCFTLPRES